MKINVFIRKLLLYVPVKMMPAFSGIFLIFFLYKCFPEGQYVSYSVSLFCSLIAAQLCAGWVGNSFIYYYTGVADKRLFASNCIAVILIIAPIASLLAAMSSVFFIAADYVFGCVWLLCFSQILFSFLSSVSQAGFFVKQQLMAVLLQAVVQIGLILIVFTFVAADFRYALLSLSVGYFAAAIVMLVATLRALGVSNPFSDSGLFKSNFKLIYEYGAALSPWMLGMLVMAGADRLVIGYFHIDHGDSYLSLKDLFVGAAGLLSMPLLMMVHPFIIKRFREGRFAVRMIESSSSFLIVAFSLLWCALYFVGFDLFERITGKVIAAPKEVVLFSFLGVFMNSAAVYFQKRLEVHRKMKLLAYLSIGSALISILFAWVGGRYWGLFGVSLGVLLAQVIYFASVTVSLLKRFDLYHGFGRAILASALALAAGYLFSIGLASVASLVWWEKSVFWVLGFAIVSLISLWKGVGWSEFMQAKV